MNRILKVVLTVAVSQSVGCGMQKKPSCSKQREQGLRDQGYQLSTSAPAAGEVAVKSSGPEDLHYHRPAADPLLGQSIAGKSYLEFHERGWQWYMLILDPKELDDEFRIMSASSSIFSSEENVRGWRDGLEAARKQVLSYARCIHNDPSRLKEFMDFQSDVRAQAHPEVLRDVEYDLEGERGER